jgi:hypothetical protein
VNAQPNFRSREEARRGGEAVQKAALRLWIAARMVAWARDDAA